MIVQAMNHEAGLTHNFQQTIMHNEVWYTKCNHPNKK